VNRLLDQHGNPVVFADPIQKQELIRQAKLAYDNYKECFVPEPLTEQESAMLFPLGGHFARPAPAVAGAGAVPRPPHNLRNMFGGKSRRKHVHRKKSRSNRKRRI
jgi:hypothetical protein